MLDHGRRILVIEDNPTNLELLLFLLRASGHDPIATRDGVSALQQAVELKPDLIICDIQLPTIDGYEVARRMKRDQRLRHITLLAVTACAMPADRDRALSAGFDGYISKPITPYTFCDEVARYLPAATSTATPACIDHDGESILVAEHSKLNLSVLDAVLAPLGCPYALAQSVREALEFLQRNKPSLLIAELDLPGGGAEALLRQGQVTTQPLPVLVLVHACTDNASIEPFQRLDRCELINWPIDPADLRRWIEKHRASNPATVAGAGVQ